MAKNDTLTTVLVLGGIGVGLYIAVESGLLNKLTSGFGGGGDDIVDIPPASEGGEDFTFEEVDDLEKRDKKDKDKFTFEELDDLDGKKSKRKKKSSKKKRRRDKDKDRDYEHPFGNDMIGYPYGRSAPSPQQYYNFNPYSMPPRPLFGYGPTQLAPPPGSISSIYTIPIPRQAYQTRGRSPSFLASKRARAQSRFVSPINPNIGTQQTGTVHSNIYSQFITGYPVHTYSPYTPYNQYPIYQDPRYYNYYNPYSPYYQYYQYQQYPYGFPLRDDNVFFSDIDTNRKYTNRKGKRKGCDDCLEECVDHPYGKDCSHCRYQCKRSGSFPYQEHSWFSWLFPYFGYKNYKPDKKYRKRRARSPYWPYYPVRTCPPGSYRASDGYCYGYPAPAPPAPPTPTPTPDPNPNPDAGSNYARSRSLEARVRNSYGTFIDLDRALQNMPRNRLDVHHAVVRNPLKKSYQTSVKAASPYEYLFDRQEDLVNIALQ